MSNDYRNINIDEKGFYTVSRPDGSYITTPNFPGSVFKKNKQFFWLWTARLAAKDDLRAEERKRRGKENAKKGIERVEL